MSKTAVRMTGKFLPVTNPSVCRPLAPNGPPNCRCC